MSFSNLHLTFASSSWLWPAIAIVVLAGGILLWSYAAQRSFPYRWACFALKLLGIAALAFCLLEPLRSAQRVRPGANLFAIIADNSQGLQIKDPGAELDRGRLLQQWLGSPVEGWQAALAENFDVRRYLFDARLQGVMDFNELSFDGRSSAIGSALKTLGERLKGRPLAGVLLFTDGNATDIGGSQVDLTGLPPIYPVVVGQETDIKDISLSQLTVSQSAFEDQPVSIQAEASAPGFRGERLAARLRDAQGKLIEEQVATVRAGGGMVPFRLQPKPEGLGLTFYELQVTAQREATPESPSASSEEATLANNARVMAVDRGGGPYRILYVAGRPNWEFKYLNRAVETDTQLQLVALIRVAKREPKFEFRGRVGETSNPLFRGFGNQAPEDVERFDQPVLVRLNTRDELELRAGFPRTAEDLYGYHAVVLDDVEAAFFAPEQATLLQKFVSERGGGVMMLGGMESFREGEYYRTPIGDMLPIYLDRTDPALQEGTPVRFDLAREGWLQAWARVRDQESAERQRIDAMPPFLVANRVRSVKPGASVVATARDQSGHDIPALVIQRFGRGRTAAMLIGDYWRWGMRDPTARTDMEKSWRQLMRWLVSEVPDRVELTVEPIPGDALGSVNLETRVRNAKFEPVDNASVVIEVEPVVFGATQPGATNVVRLRAEASASEPGLYRTTYLPRVAGGFRATAYVTNEVGGDGGRDQAGWANNPAADEFRSLVPNIALLKSIASRTGGEIVDPDDLPSFVERLPLRAAPVMESWTFPLWHTAVMFGFALACFIAEWGLRRWKGLP